MKMSQTHQSFDSRGAFDRESSIKNDESIKTVGFPTTEIKKLFAPQESHTKILPNFLSLAFGSVLRCAEYELAIIDRVSKLPPEEVILDYIPFEDKIQTVTYEIEDDYEKYPALVRDRKFQKDRTFLEKCIKLTVESLQNYHAYDILAEIVENYHRTIEEENKVILECIKNKRKRDRLRTFVEEERLRFLNCIQKTTENVGNLKDDINDIHFETEAKRKFLLKWEESRQEQQNLIMENSEQYFFDIIRKFSVQINQEDRIHEEIVSYLKENSYDNENETEMWMQRYDKELEEREIEINEVKIKIERQKDAQALLLEEFNERQKKIDDYLLHKEEQRKAAEELARQVRAAIRIQAWWRGTMFRKGLGPYKKKKHKGKKGSAGNKSSKKKKT